MRLIDADALVRHICAKRCGCEPHECGMEHDGIKMCDCVNYVVENAPTIDAEPVRHGIWSETYDPNDGFMATKYHCSACREWNTYGKSPYCPNCGARMDGGEDDEHTD